MKVSVVTFANLGKKTNLPTADILSIINAFSDMGLLQQIIGQLTSGFYFKNTQNAVPNVIRYPLRAFEKITHVSISRKNSEALLDFFASKKLEKTDAVI